MKKSFVYIVFLMAFYPLLGGGQNFNFALLTDLHISEDSSSFNDLQRSIEQINSTENISFVIISGDITDAGDKVSLMKAKSALNKLNIKYYIVSGNHENKWSESGTTDFSYVFGSERFKFEYNNVLFLGFPTGPILRMSDGHVSPQDIAWLKQNLEEVGKNKPVVLVTHYPLLEGDIDNWYEVTDAVRAYNIRAVLGGHYHRNCFFKYDGIPGVINRSNLRGKDQVGGYSIYEVRSDSMLVYEHVIGQKPVKWAAVSMIGKEYNSDNFGYGRPDYSDNEQYNVKEAWSVATGNGIYSSPVLYNNNVYVGDECGNLSCFSLRNGEKKWNYKVSGKIIGTPACSDGVIIFGATDKCIYGIDVEKGDQRWVILAKAPVLGAVAIDKGIAYVGASDHIFRAVDIKTGKQCWQYEGVKGYVETRPLIYDNKVIFGAWDDNLYALERNTGKLLWIWNNGFTRMHYSPAAVWAVASNGKVFITDPDRAMTAVDVKVGKTVWRTKQSMVRETVGISEDGLRIYSKTMQDSLVCYSALGNKPRKLWSCNVGFGYEHAPSMPVEKDGVVFGSTKNGLIFAVNAKDGKLLWKHKVGNALINTVVPLSNKKCLYTSSSGVVGLLTYRN